MLKAAQIVVIAMCYSYLCLAQAAQNIASTAFKSVVLLELIDSEGQPVSLGSGFFIGDEIIATNAHVIEGAAGGTAKLIGSDQKLPIQGTIALDRRIDLALLKVGGTAPVMTLGPDANPTVGDKVYVVGNPLGLEGTFSEGIVSGIRTVHTDTIIPNDSAHLSR
jgi:S1-C subfamily serine protease